ncbi:MAG: sensor histidine kinase [Gammaproteobacteria bacterium]|nr:sensor histidine kinase [Gammaproteobacteria bacterium]MBQ0774815.1 sensor histidine kinase [Gammaproteobacteria bacterium]
MNYPSQMTTDPAASDQVGANQSLWTPARVYDTYRVLLAFSLVTVFLFTWPQPLIGQSNPGLYLGTAITYLIITVLSAALRHRINALLRSWTPLLPFVADVLFVTTLIHASGGIESNLGILLVVSVAAASIIVLGRGGLFIAALATISIMFEQFWFSLQLSGTNPLQLTEPALLGVAFFVTSVIVQQISIRLAHSEAIAEQRRQAIHQLEAINKQIVERMRTGIIVLDPQFNVLLANPAADLLFENAARLTGTVAPAQLKDLYYLWRANPAQHRPSAQFTATGPKVMVRFANLYLEPAPLTLVFLEDQRHLAQEAQQLKLSSLGRLSATIAHEIRNPLSAINHAAGLLADGEQNAEDQRLLEIIQAHVSRVNSIIDDVLNLSRRQSSAAQRYPLRKSTQRLMEALESHQLSSAHVAVREDSPSLEVRFDPDQLDQVLFNLVSNAFKHGGDDVRVELLSGIDKRNGLPWLRVKDNGTGIDDTATQNLFEPFFTTSRQGTGLGLFVCRELCEANQARLDYEPATSGTTFVITFAHPDRMFQ